MDVDVAPAPATGQFESIQTVEGVVSPARNPLPFMFAISPSASLSASSDNNGLRSTNVGIATDARHLEREKDVTTPELSPETPLATNADKWRKYF